MSDDDSLGAKAFVFAIALSLLITAIVIPPTKSDRYHGTMWMEEREALDLVLEYDDLGDNFKIIGEGNSVELKYDFYTNDDVDGFYKSGGDWFDKYGAWTFIAISIFFWTVLLLMFSNDFMNRTLERIREKAKNGNI